MSNVAAPGLFFQLAARLIGGLKRVREHGGTVNLVCSNPQIRKIFDITGLVKIFGIFDNEDAALKALV